MAVKYFHTIDGKLAMFKTHYLCFVEPGEIIQPRDTMRQILNEREMSDAYRAELYLEPSTERYGYVMVEV